MMLSIIVLIHRVATTHQANKIIVIFTAHEKHEIPHTHF